MGSILICLFAFVASPSSSVCLLLLSFYYMWILFQGNSNFPPYIKRDLYFGKYSLFSTEGIAIIWRQSAPPVSSHVK